MALRRGDSPEFPPEPLREDFAVVELDVQSVHFSAPYRERLLKSFNHDRSLVTDLHIGLAF